MNYTVKSRQIRRFIGIATALLVLDYFYFYIRMFRNSIDDNSSKVLEERLMGGFARVVHRTTARNFTTVTDAHQNVTSSNGRRSHPVRGAASTTIGMQVVVEDKKEEKVKAGDFRLPSAPEEQRPSLPHWMTDYFQWHSQQVTSLTVSSWDSKKYLVLYCGTRTNCGGISDRLKPLPFLVLLAYRSQRVLMILWIKPAPLEEYLVPPQGGLDWRVPDWLRLELVKADPHTAIETRHVVDYTERLTNETVLFTKIQVPTAGQDYYDSQSDSLSTYQTVYHSLFRTFFTPAPRLQALISSKMKDNNLVPGQYSSAHLRAMYGNRVYRDPYETIALTVNAVNCASNLLPGSPVYFAADIKFAVQVAQEYGRQRSLPVAALDFLEDPLHLDKDDAWQTRDSSAYDDTFVDLYLLAQSRCVAYRYVVIGAASFLVSPICHFSFLKHRACISFLSNLTSHPNGLH
jgi:hypothetical protein